MSIRSDSDGDPCPVPDDQLGELYRASKEGLPRLIATVSPKVRAALALYCYRRAHLRGVGLAVASTCEKHDLVAWGGAVGAALFARSRESAAEVPAAAPGWTRQKITLASGNLRKSLPIDEEPDDVDAEEPGAEDGSANAAGTGEPEASEPDESGGGETVPR